MSRKLKATFIVACLFSVTIIGCTQASEEAGGAQFDGNVIADIELANARDNLKLLSEIDAQIGADQRISLQRLVAQSMLRQIMNVRLAQPEIESLSGNSLETLCLLTDNRVTDALMNTSGAAPAIAELATSYLEKNIAEVRAQIKLSQANLLGSGCYLSPPRD